jgi:hypothetical protein
LHWTKGIRRIYQAFSSLMAFSGFGLLSHPALRQ